MVDKRPKACLLVVVVVVVVRSSSIKKKLLLLCTMIKIYMEIKSVCCVRPIKKAIDQR